LTFETASFEVGEGDVFECFYTDTITDRELDVYAAEGHQGPGGHHVMVFYTNDVHTPTHHPCVDSEMVNWNMVAGAAGSGAAEAEVPAASLAQVNFPAKAFYLLAAVGICASSSEARRHIQGGGVKLDGAKLADPNQEFAAAAELEGKVLQLGKKTFRRLVA
jgi:hypothetical protein